jgi:hypothetical protein
LSQPEYGLNVDLNCVSREFAHRISASNFQMPQGNAESQEEKIATQYRAPLKSKR